MTSRILYTLFIRQLETKIIHYHSRVCRCRQPRKLTECIDLGKVQSLCIILAMPKTSTEAEFLDEIQTKVLRVFLLVIHSHLYNFALRFLFLQTHTTSYSFYSSVTLHGTIPLPYGLRNPYRKSKSANSQDYAQKPQQNRTFMNSASIYTIESSQPHPGECIAFQHRIREKV
jgi:hypothetical protein